jgi:hypothetical protein
MPKTLRIYYDDLSSLFHFGRGGLPALGPLPLTGGDVVHVQLQVVTGPFPWFNRDGSVADADTVNLSTFTNWLLVLKTPEQYRAAGDFSYAQAGFDEDDPWHDPAHGRLAMALVVPGTVAAGQYYLGVVLLDAQSARTHLGPLPLDVWLTQPVMVGDEASAPEGTTGAQSDDFTIAGTETEVIIPITGLTASGRCAVGQLPPTGAPGDAIFIEDYSTAGQLRIYVAAAPGTGNAYNGHWTLQKLS